MNIGFWILITILIICIFFGFLYKQGEGLLDWHNLIVDEKYQTSVLKTKFDPNKPIVFMPEQFVGLWVNDEFYPVTINKEEKENIMRLLSANYNIFLQLSNLNIKRKDVSRYCDYINQQKYPICFISNKFPPTDVLYDISFNDGKYWLAVYDYKRYVKEEK